MKNIYNMKIVAATNNSHKISEITSILDKNIILVSLADINIHEDIPEEENTLEGNARAKARYVNIKNGMDVFADDTGLEVNCLGNKPGVYSARYAGEQCNSDDNIELLLKEMKNCSDRKARFRTIIVLILNNQEYTFEGIVNGRISSKRSGKEGFGYDPVFIPEGEERSFAEMSLEEKNMISHRARAVRKLTDFLLSHQGNNATL